jgi:hypothetical protein
MSFWTAYCKHCQRLLYLSEGDESFCPVCSSPVVATSATDGNGHLQRRLARNEVSFRSLNETIERAAEGNGHHRARFLCECADKDCSEALELTLDQYEGLRKNHSRFLVVRGHEDERIEMIIERNGSYSIVEKTGEAGALAERTDPRT